MSDAANATGASVWPVTAPALPDHLEATHRRFLMKETLLGMAIGALLPSTVIWLFRTPLPMPTFGNGSLASSLIMGTLAPGFGMPIGLTYAVRYRVRAGSAPGLGWPLRSPGLVRFVPGPVILRGLLAAGIATLILPPAGLLLMMAAGVETVSANGFIVYNLIHGMALGALVLRPVLTRALADEGGAVLAAGPDADRVAAPA